MVTDTVNIKKFQEYKLPKSSLLEDWLFYNISYKLEN